METTRKIDLEKYYTPKESVELCCKILNETLDINNISEIIEPSAGAGAFLDSYKDIIAYDIAPEDERIIKQDFLTLDLEYKKDRLFLGNPPFGHCGNLAISFYNKCCDYGDYIAFVLPITYYNKVGKLYKFDLIKSEKLGIIKYNTPDGTRSVNTCFNIYKRNNSGKHNPKPIPPKFTGLKVKRYDRTKCRKNDHLLDLECDLRLGTFGAGCIGRIPSKAGQFAQEFLIWVDRENKDDVINFIKEFNYKDYDFVGVPILTQTRLHQILIDKFGK